MRQKSIPLSLRISDDDAAFLAALQVPGATTPSEKLRSLLREARRRKAGAEDYPNCLALLRDMTEPARQRVRRMERERKVYSELTGKLYDWLPEILATLIVFRPQAEDDLEQVRDFERDVAEKVLVLMEATLRLGLTRESRCYDPALIADRLDGVLELADLLARKRRQAERRTT